MGDLYVSNGSETADWPAVGAIVAYNEGTGDHGICSGTLIAPDAVLTAAHCVPLIEADEDVGYRVYFVRGPDVFDRKVGFSELDGASSHPGYATDDYRSDVAVLRLRAAISGVDPMIWTEEPVGDAWLGRPITLVGYGNVDDLGTTWGTKRTGTALVDGWDADWLVTRAQADTQNNTCHGDSGSPLLEAVDDGWVIAGVVSWGGEISAAAPCGRTTGASRMDVYGPWVREQLAPVDTDDTDVPADTDVVADTGAPEPRACGCATGSPSWILAILTAPALRRARRASA